MGSGELTQDNASVDHLFEVPAAVQLMIARRRVEMVTEELCATDDDAVVSYLATTGMQAPNSTHLRPLRNRLAVALRQF